MAYESLKKIYYKDNLKWEEEYRNRFNSPFTEHFDFNIKQYGYDEVYPAFLCHTAELSYLINAIHTLNYDLTFKLISLPSAAAHQLTQAYMIEEIQASNEIEGVRSSKKEIRAALELAKLSNKDKAVRFSSIVSKYNKLLNKTKIKFDTCQDIRQFYDEFILSEVTSENERNKPDGTIFRADNVEITTGTQKILHIGTYPEAKLIDEMEKALAILHNEKYPLVIRVAIFHYLFAYSHPFYDGNGRTIRFITSYFLAMDFSPLVAFNLSLLIKRNRKNYYTMFEETTSAYNRGDLGFFVTEFLHIIKWSIEDVIDCLDKQIDQLRKWDIKLKSLKIKDKTTYDLYKILLQTSIFFAEGITMQDMTNILQKSTNTIKSRLATIPEEHLIIDTSEKFYRYKLDLKELQSSIVRKNILTNPDLPPKFIKDVLIAKDMPSTEFDLKD